MTKRWGLFDRVLALDPQDAKAWYKKGTALAQEFSHVHEAIPCFEKTGQLGIPNAAQAIAAWREALRKYRQTYQK